MKLLYGSAIFTLISGIICHVVSPNVNFSPQAVTQNILSNDYDAVPGQNSLKYCDGKPQEDLLQISYVNVDPNPPIRGQTVSLEVVGQLHENVTAGAYIIVSVKIGLISLLRTTLDLCETVSKANINCPIEKGPIKIHREVKLPDAIPPAVYTVQAYVFTEDDRELVCLKSKVPMLNNPYAELKK